MSKLCIAIACVLLLGGCADQITDFAREPHLTPVGAGLRPDRVAILSEPPPPARPIGAATRSGRTPAPISSAIRAPCGSAT